MCHINKLKWSGGGGELKKSVPLALLEIVKHLKTVLELCVLVRS